MMPFLAGFIILHFRYIRMKPIIDFFPDQVYLLKCKTTTLQVEITCIEFGFVSNRMLPSWTMNTS